MRLDDPEADESAYDRLRTTPWPASRRRGINALALVASIILAALLFHVAYRPVDTRDAGIGTNLPIDQTAPSGPISGINHDDRDGQ